MKKRPALFIVTLFVLFVFSTSAQTLYRYFSRPETCKCRHNRCPQISFSEEEIEYVPVLLN